MSHTDYSNWSATREDLRVDEVEHMFGFDVMLSQKIGPQMFGPLRTITGRTREMNWVERRIALRWMSAYDSKEWGLIQFLEQELHQE